MHYISTMINFENMSKTEKDVLARVILEAIELQYRKDKSDGDKDTARNVKEKPILDQ